MKTKYAHRGHLAQKGYPEYGTEITGDAFGNKTIFIVEWERKCQINKSI